MRAAETLAAAQASSPIRGCGRDCSTAPYPNRERKGLLEDAIHLATALKLAGAGILNTVMTNDARLASAVELHGLRVAAP